VSTQIVLAKIGYQSYTCHSYRKRQTVHIIIDNLSMNYFSICYLKPWL